jgi:hypothetical protein
MQANEMLHTITCLQHLFFKEWYSPGTSASSTTKTGRHDIAEILIKVALIIIILCLPKAIQLIDTLQFFAKLIKNQYIPKIEIVGDFVEKSLFQYNFPRGNM